MPESSSVCKFQPYDGFVIILSFTSARGPVGMRIAPGCCVFVMKSGRFLVAQSLLMVLFLSPSALFAETDVLQGWGFFLGGAHVPPGLSNGISAVACGSDFSLALRTDGAVVGWGNNDVGQASPPAGLSGVVAIAAGIHQHALALKGDGRIVAWGNNNHGESTVPAGLQGVIAIDANGGSGGQG